MITVGIIVLLIGSIVRGWGTLNHSRPPFDQPLVFRNALFSLAVSIGSILLGLISCIIIGSETGFFTGMITFGAFWFLSWIWVPILASIGL